MPTGSVIQITPPTDVDFIMSSDSNILKNHIFSTKLWSGVILSGNSLYITFMEELDAEEQIEIYIENAINNP